MLTGCNKPKSGSGPTLKFKNVSTTELHSGGNIQFTLSFTDAGSSISDSIYVEEVVANCTNSSFSQFYAIPAFPASKNQQGDLTVTYGYNSPQSYQQLSPKCEQNDTAVFRFVLSDNAQHISDTVSSPSVIIFYP